MFRRVAPAGTFNSTDFVTQSESALNSGTSAGKPNEPPSNISATRAVCQPSLPIFRFVAFMRTETVSDAICGADFHVGMYVVELTAGVPILDAQPVLAVFRDDPEFLVVRNIESLGPPRIDAGVLEIPLGKQVHLGRGASCHDAEQRENQRELNSHVRSWV